MKIIYFASPYSDSNPDVVNERYNKTCNKVAELFAQGHIVMSPIVYGHTLLQYKEMPGDWQFWKNFCESFLYKSDEMFVYKIEGWNKSTGLLAELELAKSLNIKITYLEE
jgi:hypothetical protein